MLEVLLQDYGFDAAVTENAVPHKHPFSFFYSILGFASKQIFTNN